MPVHVAILVEPYLTRLLDGSKTVECRLTQQAREPFESIEPGERIYFKQSAGPYRAVAVAEQVLCERDLSPARVRELQRDYNDLICGEDSFWDDKRDAGYATLIWLGDVRRTSVGPKIAALQGRAWKRLDEDPAWRRVDEAAGAAADDEVCNAEQPFCVTLTAGNIRNRSVSVNGVVDRFPAWAQGGATRQLAAKPLTLSLHAGRTIETDIVRDKRILRTRQWTTWFRKHDVRPGDRVVFTPVDEGVYFVGLHRSP